MGNYENLKQSITEVIRTNGNQEITGSVLQSTLLTIISTVGANATFAGKATPTTNPGTPDGPVFYIASESGTYSNFGSIVLQDGLSVLMWNGSWSSQQIFGVDDVPTAGSDNLVKSRGVFSNSSWSLEEKEEFNVVDKNGKKGFSVGKDGTKARAYNIVDENGDIISTIGENTQKELTYDVSARNGGAVFESLQALLSSSNLNTLIPTSVRCGGMSIRFIQGSAQSSDNKYVQYRLMSDTFNTTEANWQGIDDEPTAKSDNLVKSGGIFSNSSWSLEEKEEFNIADKNGKKALSVGKDGVKAKAYNIVDENGDIISTIGEADKLGDGGFFQEKKGTYYFPTSISSSGSGLSYAVVGNEAKFEKSIKVEVSGITPTSDTSFTNRGSLILNFDNPIEVKKTLSVWYFVPTKYWRPDYRGGDSNICLDHFHLYFYTGDIQIYDELVSLYHYHCGWNLFKFLTDELANTKITKIEIRFLSYNNHPNFVCYLGHFVADQRMKPILNFNMDGRLDGITYTSGFAQWLMNNNIPVDLRLYDIGNYEDGEAEWVTITRKMYFSGLINGMTYSGEAKNYTLQQAVTYLKTSDVLHGRESALYSIPAARDIILCGAANNFVDDELLLAAKLAGYKMIRDSNAYDYTSYIDFQCCIMPTYGVCPIRDVSLSGDELEAEIATEVSKAKAKIDNIIKYGMAMSMFTHQAASKTQQGQSGFNTLASYAEGVEEVLSYALQKQSEGKLLVKSMYNIINNN